MPGPLQLGHDVGGIVDVPRAGDRGLSSILVLWGNEDQLRRVQLDEVKPAVGVGERDAGPLRDEDDVVRQCEPADRVDRADDGLAAVPEPGLCRFGAEEPAPGLGPGLRAEPFEEDRFRLASASLRLRPVSSGPDGPEQGDPER